MTAEDPFVAALRAVCDGTRTTRVRLGTGDDAAAWQPSRSALSVVTTDALVEGVHFTHDLMSDEEIGHRALAANLSDIAAMGARPVIATIALGVPRGAALDGLVALYRGMAALAARTRCALAGGDVVRTPSLTLAITVVGEVRPSSLATRDGARPGDVLAVTGTLGRSRAGLALAGEHRAAATALDAPLLDAFRRPEPRLAEGAWLARSRATRAMMDLSDGLSTDLPRLGAASGTGATIEDVPIDPAAAGVAARVGADARAWGLGGGEDYELLVAVERRAFAHLARRFAARFGRPLHRIGIVTEGAGVRDAKGETITPSGWDSLA